jgi:hypothetical protein
MEHMRVKYVYGVPPKQCFELPGSFEIPGTEKLDRFGRYIRGDISSELVKNRGRAGESDTEAVAPKRTRQHQHMLFGPAASRRIITKQHDADSCGAGWQPAADWQSASAPCA